MLTIREHALIIGKAGLEKKSRSLDSTGFIWAWQYEA